MTDIVSSDLTGIRLQYGSDTPINITALQVQEGTSAPVAVWAEAYTLSITKTNPGYIKSATVNRTASQYGHGATGELANGATLYYGDTLTAAATAADTTTSYTEWVPASIADPTFTNKTDTSVQVNNPNAFAVTLYYKLSTASSYTSVAIAASSNTTLSSLTAGSEYEFYFTASKSRTKTVTTYSVTKSWASLTVDSNESITFTGAASPVESTESGTLTSNTASYIMPYKITLTKNTNVASISLTYTKAGASSTTTVTTAGTYYAEASSYYSWSATAATGYVLSSSSGQGWMTSACTIAPTASRQTFTVTFALGGSNYGSWSTASIAVEYGDTMSRSGNTVTIKKWDDASTNRGTSTFTNGSATEYDYSVSYSTITSPITANQTVTATTSRTRKTFTITLALGGSNYGSWSKASMTAQYGDLISLSGNTVTLYKWDATSTARDSSTFTNGSATEYNYSVSYNTPTSPVTAAQTITATTSRSRKTFTITFAKGGSNYGSWSKSSITAQYGDLISRSGNTVTIYKWDATSTARDSSTFTNGSATEYDYSVSYSAITSPITADQTITATTSRSRKTFTITFSAAGTGSGSWSSATITAQYGDTMSRSDNVVTIKKWDDSSANRGTSTFTVSTGYKVSAYSTITTPITSNQTIAASTARIAFLVTFAKTGTSDSAWDSSIEIAAEYGDYIQRNGDTVTVYKWDATSTARASRTFNNGTNAAYTYGTATYTNAPTTKTQLNRSTTYAVSVAQDWTRKSLTVTLSKSGATDSAWSKATLTGYYGDQIAVSGTTVTLYKWDSTSTSRDSATFNNGTNAAYTYGTATYTGVTSTKTAINNTTATVTATQSWTRKSFKVYLNKDAHPNSVWKTGSTAVTYLTAYYGDWIQRSDATVTIYKWDADTTARTSATFSNSSNPNTVWYNANAPTTKTQLNRSTDYTLSCVTGWTITYAGSNGTWKRNGTASTTLTAYYGDQVSISTTSSSATVTIYIGSDTSRIRDSYARIFTPSTGYNVSGCTSLSTVTGRHTITATTQAAGVTITFTLGGSYCTTYRGTLRCTSGSATGTEVWSKAISSNTSSGTILGTVTLPQNSTTSYYLSGSDVYESGAFNYYVSSGSFTADSAKTVTITISRRRALSCMNPGCLGNEGYN